VKSPLNHFINSCFFILRRTFFFLPRSSIGILKTFSFFFSCTGLTTAFICVLLIIYNGDSFELLAFFVETDDSIDVLGMVVWLKVNDPNLRISLFLLNTLFSSDCNLRKSFIFGTGGTSVISFVSPTSSFILMVDSKLTTLS